MPRKVRTRKYGKSRVNKRKHRRSLKKKMNKRSTKKTRQYRKNRTRRRLGGNYSNLKEFEENAELGEFFHKNADRQLGRISYIKLNGNKSLKYYDAELEGGSNQSAYVLISDNLAWNGGRWNQKEFEDDNEDLISALQTLPDEQQKSILDEILNLTPHHNKGKIDATMATLAKNKKGSVLGKRRKDEYIMSGKKARHVYWDDQFDGGFDSQLAKQNPDHNIGDTIEIYHNNQQGNKTYKVTNQGLEDTETGEIHG